MVFTDCNVKSGSVFGTRDTHLCTMFDQQFADFDDSLTKSVLNVKNLPLEAAKCKGEILRAVQRTLGLAPNSNSILTASVSPFSTHANSGLAFLHSNNLHKSWYH